MSESCSSAGSEPRPGTGAPPVPPGPNACAPPTGADRAARLLLVSLALVAIGDLGAFWIQTDGGSVDVVGLKLPTQNGQWIAADLFRPKDATSAHRVPLVVVCPGFERSKESMDSYSIELSRRDIAVLTIDPYNQGASSSTAQRRSVSVEGNGVVPALEYVCDTPNLNYVDRARIGAAGYSAGGNAVIQTASLLGRRSRSAARVSAVFAGGYVQSLTDEVLATVHANVGIDYARYDEGSYRNENGDADMARAPEALRLVNSVLPGDAAIRAVEIGRFYGDPAKGTLRVVYNTRNIHPLLPYDTRSVAHLVDFFTAAFGGRPAPGPFDQRWMFKELFTLASLVGSLLSLVPLADLLLRLPAFRSLAQAAPPPLPRPDRTGRLVFWAAFALLATAACALFVPLIHATATLFPEASASRPTWWFPQRMNNAVLLWAVANGTLGLAVFSLNYHLIWKKRGVLPSMWGIRIGAAEWAKTLGLALTVFAAFYALVFLSYGLFHVDFRFLFISAAASFPRDMLLVAAEYVPPFFIFYLANSIRVNAASRFEGQNERLGGLIMGLGNSVGLMMILVIQYGHLAFSTSVFWTREWIYMDLLFGVIPMMFVLPYFNRSFFRLTGRVHLGPMVTCLVFIMMMLTSNVCYLPLR